MIRKNIPNALTLCNLLCGCVAIVEAFHNNILLSSVLMAIALIFDFFDGFAARLLGVSSPIGRDLDSLADMVTFGVLPAIIVYQLLMQSIPDLFGIWKAYPAFLIAIFSAIRLAKFNNDPRQSDSFIGVPTPANGILIASLPFMVHFGNEYIKSIIVNTNNLLILTVIMSLLLVSEIKLVALKFKSFGWAHNEARYILILTSVVLLAIFNIFAVPMIMVLYILISVGVNVLAKKSETHV